MIVHASVSVSDDDYVNADQPMYDVDVSHVYDFHDELQAAQHVPINFQLKWLYHFQDPVD